MNCLGFECIPPTISDQLYFIHDSTVWGMLRYGSVGQVQNKECYTMSFKNATISF